jgi:hypothetical protein
MSAKSAKEEDRRGVTADEENDAVIVPRLFMSGIARCKESNLIREILCDERRSVLETDVTAIVVIVALKTCLHGRVICLRRMNQAMAVVSITKPNPTGPLVITARPAHRPA